MKRQKESDGVHLERQRPRREVAPLREDQPRHQVRLQNLERVRTLKAEQADQIAIFCAHDAAEFDALAAR